MMVDTRGVSCTAFGSPRTWQQILPAAVSADPSSGTISTGYVVLNVGAGDVATDLRALSTLIHSLRTALVDGG